MYLFLFGAIVAIIGVVAGIYLGGYLTERSAKKAEQQAAPPPAATETPAQKEEKRRFWFGSKQIDPGIRFQNWASANIQDGELRAWLVGLTKEQVGALTEQLSTFCTSLGFNLDWLISKQLNSNTELDSTAMDIVENYCTACLQATTAQSKFEQFKKVMDVVEQPFSRNNKALAQKLYTDLVNRSVTPAMPPDVMMGNEQTRQAHISAALKEVSANNWETFIAAFEDATKVDDTEKKPGWKKIVRNPFDKGKKDEVAGEVVATGTPQEQAA